VCEYHWSGDRQSNRQASADAAVALLLETLKNRDNLEHLC
jgi:nicotinamide mononucleotide (NMN) deamidase PncC